MSKVLLKLACKAPTLRSRAPKGGLGCYELKEDGEQEAQRLLEESDWEEVRKLKKAKTATRKKAKAELSTSMVTTDNIGPF